MDQYKYAIINKVKNKQIGEFENTDDHSVYIANNAILSSDFKEDVDEINILYQTFNWESISRVHVYIDLTY